MPLPPGTTRAAIAIGVDRTGQLAPLAAAVRGALEIRDWFSAEGYHVTALTDANGGKVRVADVFDAVSDALDTDSLTTLVIYFAGHGYYSVGSEIWLLSGAPGNPNEAINLGESTVAARGSGLLNAVFIADTCRSVPQTVAANAVRGSSIFPICQSSFETQIDTFYATNPGDVAVEVTANAQRTNYDGLFTKVLHNLHDAAPPKELVIIPVDANYAAVLPNRRLRRLVPEHFAKQARAIGAVISQTPSLRIESDEPFYVATARPARVVKVPQPENVIGLMPSGVVPYGLDDSPVPNMADAARNLINTGKIPQPQLIRLPRQNPSEIQLANEARSQKGAETDGGFETQCGFFVSGSSIVDGVCIGGPWGEIEAPGQPDNKFRVCNERGDWGPATKLGSAVLRFADGTGTILAAIPGYTGSIIVRDGGIISVSYAPAPNSPKWYNHPYMKDMAEERRAIAATIARHGILAMDREDARKFANFIRIDKEIDPTLGIYAALAYASVGLSKDAASVLHFMQRDLRANLLDVWLLAGADRAERVKWPIVPAAPMLSQSWDYLKPRGEEIPAILANAARHQSLWTTFLPEAMDAVLVAALRGELG